MHNKDNRVSDKNLSLISTVQCKITEDELNNLKTENIHQKSEF